MKKVLFLLFAFLLSYPSFGQAIAVREENEKVLLVGTNYMSDYTTGVSLMVLSNKETGEKIYELGLYFDLYGRTLCQKGSKAIFKTFNGTIITLRQITETGDVISRRKLVNSSRINEELDRYRLQTDYRITEDDLQTLMHEGIQLMRIETLIGLKDYTYRKDALGGFLSAEYDLILDKKDFESNF